MPRGGAREGAGRKTQWVSGCAFSETTVVRVPRILKDKVLEVTHRLDAGEEIDLVTNSVKERNTYLENRVLQLEVELKELKSAPKQLSLSSLELVTKTKSISGESLQKMKSAVLRALGMGSQAKRYKQVEKTFNKEIKRILSERN